MKNTIEREQLVHKLVAHVFLLTKKEKKKKVARVSLHNEQRRWKQLPRTQYCRKKLPRRNSYSQPQIFSTATCLLLLLIFVSYCAIGFKQTVPYDQTSTRKRSNKLLINGWPYNSSTHVDRRLIRALKLLTFVSQVIMVRPFILVKNLYNKITTKCLHKTSHIECRFLPLLIWQYNLIFDKWHNYVYL